MPARLLFLGPPGGGKGTHASRLAAEIGVPHIAAGDMLRGETARHTALGRRAKSHMDAGELVPDELVVEIVIARLSAPDTEAGWILDGFPRDLRQAEDLEERLGERGLEAVIALDVGEEEVIDRISGRRSCVRGHVYHVYKDPPKTAGICDRDGQPLEQRDDDKEDLVRHRLEIYRQATEPLIDFYMDRGLLVRVHAGGAPNDVYPRVVAALSGTT